MAANTSCSVTNSRLGPAMAASSPPRAMAAGRIAKAAMTATSVSEETTMSAFFSMFSFFSR